MRSTICAADERGLKVENGLGNPERNHASPSGVERQQVTMRPFTRRPNGLANKRINHAHAVARHGRYDNFGRSHQSRDATPAMAAKGSNTPHDLDGIVDRVAETQLNPRRPKT